MKILCAPILVILSYFSWSGETNLYKVTLNEKIDSSDLIFTGMVISQYSEWNTDHSLIITISDVQLVSVFKGATNKGVIRVKTFGGKVGNDMMITSSLLDLSDKDYGMFFCSEEEHSALYTVYSSKQGFIKYLNGQAIAPFYNAEISELEKVVQTEVGALSAVIGSNTPTPVPVSVVSNLSFSPPILTSGTGSLLTLSGSGFGTVGPDTLHYVAFANADNGGAPSYIAPSTSSYVSWTDTMIVVQVPTPAGTGPIKIFIDSVAQYTSSELIIPWAILNSGNNVIPSLVNLNGSGGQTWTFNSNMLSSGADPFNRAFDSWKCATGVNWIISGSTTSISAPNAVDGYNIVARGSVPSGVLGVTYNYYTSCNGTDWYVYAQDMIFRNTGVSWYYATGTPNGWQYDFESVALHELGHAHLLGHVVENQDPLYYAIGQGVAQRDLSFYNIVAGNFIMGISGVQNPCPPTPMIQNLPATCSVPPLTDAWMLEPSDPLTNSICFGFSDVKISFTNAAIDTITQVIINWSVNGNLQTPTVWNGSIGPNEFVNDYIVGSYDFQDSLYAVEVWFNQVNGQQEMNSANDTLYLAFNPIPCSPDNAAIANLDYFDPTTCHTSENIVIDLINTGTNALTSCWVYFSANGITVDSVQWTGSINPSDTVQNISIGFNTIFYPSVNIMVWISSTNGFEDSYHANDTINYFFAPYRLNGTYAVGGSQPDFQDLSDAVQLLNDYGICGDVVLNVRSGNYSGNFYFDSIPSNSSSFKVTIQSEAGDSDSVHYYYNTTPFATSNFMEFDSTKNVIIKDLSFHFDAASFYEELIYIGNGASDLTFDGLFLDLSDINYVDNQTAKKAVYIYGNTPSGNRPCNDLTFVNNRIEYGANAFYFLDGATISSGIFPKGLLIENNTILNQSNRCIELYGGKGTVLRNNVFNSENIYNNTSSYYPQTYFSECQDSLILEGNIFHYTGQREVLFIENCMNTATNNIKVINNTMNLTSVSSDKNAVKVSNSGYIDFFNNTIISHANAPFAMSGATMFISICDSVSLINNHLVNYNDALAIRIENTPISGNYNNIYTSTGNILSNINGVNSNSLSQHQANTGLDANSISEDPLLPGNFYLIPTNFSIDNSGTPLSSVVTDIDGVIRNPLTPDIGAYEFQQYDYDIGVLGSPINGGYACSGTNTDIYIDVCNFGIQDIDSFYVYININNFSYDSVLINQYIAAGDTANVLVGAYLLNGSLSNTINTETALPNGIADSAVLNNLNSFNVSMQLNGSYTVGGAGTDFIYLNDAVDYLNQAGVCGPVIFNITDGTYNGLSVTQMTISAYPGMSSNNPVTFQSQSMDSSMVSMNLTDPAFVLNNVEYMNFKHLSFYPSDAFDYILTLNTASHINVSNCSFNNGRIYASNDAIEQIEIEKSLFLNAAGIYFTNNSAPGDSIYIHDNVFQNGSRIDFDGPYNFSIDHNVFELTGNNRGVYLDECNHFDITHNKWLASDGGPLIQNCTSIGGANLVANNFFRSYEVGLDVNNSDSVFIINNSFYQYTQPPYTSITGCVTLLNNTNVLFMNNILSSVRPGAIVYLGAADTASFEPNNNIYFKNPDSVIRIFGGNNDYISWSQWQEQGKDMASFYANPYYLSAGDLHIDNLVIADSNAVAYPFVQDDIDGDLRDFNYPDIGADEIDLNYSTLHNIKLVNILEPDTNICAGADSMVITVTNFSIFPVDSFVVISALNSFPLDSVWIFQSMQPGDTIIVNMGQFDFIQNTMYVLDIKTTWPNNQIDNYELDNTQQTEYIYYDNLQIVSVPLSDCSTDYELIVPNFPYDSILWSTGSTNDIITITPPGTYSVTVTGGQGCVVTANITLN